MLCCFYLCTLSKYKSMTLYYNEHILIGNVFERLLDYFRKRKGNKINTRYKCRHFYSTITIKLICVCTWLFPDNAVQYLWKTVVSRSISMAFNYLPWQSNLRIKKRCHFRKTTCSHDVGYRKSSVQKFSRKCVFFWKKSNAQKSNWINNAMSVVCKNRCS